MARKLGAAVASQLGRKAECSTQHTNVCLVAGFKASAKVYLKSSLFCDVTLLMLVVVHRSSGPPIGPVLKGSAFQR